MKKTLSILIVLCFVVFSIRAQAVTQAFDADGIKVIFKPTSKNVINVRMYFKGGVTNYTKSQAGIENLTLNAATKCGTGKYSVTAFKDTADKYDILMSGASTLDYGYIQLNCISKYFNNGWDLFSEAIMNPVFDADEVNLLKNKVIAADNSYESIPENHLNELQMQNAFSNTPYAISPSGNQESLEKLKADDLKKYFKSLLNKNKLFIVVVGNITKQEIFEKIVLAFGNIPSLTYTPVELKTPVWNDNKLFTEDRTLTTNYIKAIMNAPEFTSVNYIPFRLGISGLGGNLYQNLRTIRNLAYSIGSETVALKMPYASMHAGTGNVAEMIPGMLKTLKSIQNYGLNEEWLQHIKNTYITRSFIDDQSAAAITANLGRAEILGGWQYGDDLPQLVQMVTVEQVNNALNFYIAGLRWTYLGNPDAITGFKIPQY